MIADYSAEIKIVIFQSMGNANMMNEDRRQIAAKIAHFNSVNSENSGRKFTKFRHIIAIERFESGFMIG